MNWMIQPARLWHRAALGRMAMESKAFWGYDQSFLLACAQDLQVSWSALLSGSVWIAKGDDGSFLGFYCVEYGDDGPELTHLFVRPLAMGQGLGRYLWTHALREICKRKSSVQKWTLTIHSDPHAAGFYETMGAVMTGRAESSVKPGRFLPVYEYEIKGVDALGA